MYGRRGFDLYIIRTAHFGKKPLLCYRVIKSNEYVFDDEDMLHPLQNKEKRVLRVHTKLEMLTCRINCTLYGVWMQTLRETTIRIISYYEIYFLTEHLGLISIPQLFFSPTYDIDCRKVTQPIPDLLRWVSVHELHYMPWQEAAQLQFGPWMEQIAYQFCN